MVAIYNSMAFPAAVLVGLALSRLFVGNQTQVNVLLDGAYLHGGCPNRMDPPTSYAALETYEKVTVEKGVQTLQHGSGGSGGTVLFERDTRSQIDPEDGLSGKASLTGSTNGIKHDLSVDVTKPVKGYVRVFAQDAKQVTMKMVMVKK